MDPNNLLTYQDFNEIFEIHTGASAFQSGEVIIQKVIPMAFYAVNLTGDQQQYTVTEKDILNIIETLNWYRTILLGQKIRIYTDPKNLIYKNFNTDRVLIWRLILR